MGIGSIFRRTPDATPLERFTNAMRVAERSAGFGATTPSDLTAVKHQRAIVRRLDTAYEAARSVVADPEATPGMVATAHRIAAGALDAKAGVAMVARGDGDATEVLGTIRSLRNEAAAERTVAQRWGETWRDLTPQLNEAWGEIESVDSGAPHTDVLGTLGQVAASGADETAGHRIADIAADVETAGWTTDAERRGQRRLVAALSTGPVAAALSVLPMVGDELAVAGGLTSLLGAAGVTAASIRRDLRSPTAINTAIVELAAMASDDTLSMGQRRGLVALVQTLAPETSQAAREADRIPTAVRSPGGAALDEAIAGLRRVAKDRPHTTSVDQRLSAEIDEALAELQALTSEADARHSAIADARRELGLPEHAPLPARRAELA